MMPAKQAPNQHFHGHLGVRLDAPAQFGAAASLAAILRPSGPGAPWKCCEMACESR